MKIEDTNINIEEQSGGVLRGETDDQLIELTPDEESQVLGGYEFKFYSLEDLGISEESPLPKIQVNIKSGYDGGFFDGLFG